MRTLIDLQKKLFPDLLEVMQQRYTILNSVQFFQPIGRRSLAEHSSLTERHVRAEVDFLHEQGLINVTSKGMLITEEGKVVVEQLSNFMKDVMGLSVLEKQLTDKLQIGQVIVVPGNSDHHDWVKQEMGKACVSFLKSRIPANYTIAVTGGTTMAAVAKTMTPLDESKQYLFVPARGGIGEQVENQANTIVAEMAKKAKGDYRMLYVPDPLSEISYQTMINEPSINEILQLIRGANVVLHGIGDAKTMAMRRKTPEQVIRKLDENNAVSEAFGYYFNKEGDVVYKVRTIGIQLEDLKTVDCVITVAGGISKAQAIASYFEQGKSDLLITDEAAAEQILRDTSL
ncbi:sugar-binding transcriptional regulator [Virgibacillus oceani]|uniref:Central glycolytic genes regulator n=1 Tax=Virgibacillus oceani TaxID=1479511 RepID=A0A917LYE4_9BACI|nr:sugar-binding domain-containing protein [Virgibacillus oceani]GGG66959.1 central glycolytic genes regulator [Virgibacillus oceani]